MVFEHPVQKPYRISMKPSPKVIFQIYNVTTFKNIPIWARPGPAEEGETLSTWSIELSIVLDIFHRDNLRNSTRVHSGCPGPGVHRISYKGFNGGKFEDSFLGLSFVPYRKSILYFFPKEDILLLFGSEKVICSFFSENILCLILLQKT